MKRILFMMFFSLALIFVPKDAFAECSYPEALDCAIPESAQINIEAHTGLNSESGTTTIDIYIANGQMEISVTETSVLRKSTSHFFTSKSNSTSTVRLLIKILPYIGITTTTLNFPPPISATMSDLVPFKINEGIQITKSITSSTVPITASSKNNLFGSLNLNIWLLMWLITVAAFLLYIAKLKRRIKDIPAKYAKPLPPPMIEENFELETEWEWKKLAQEEDNLL